MTWLRRQFRTFEALSRAWWYYATPLGKGLTILCVVCLPVLVTLDSPLFFLLTATVALLAATWIVGVWYRPKLTVQLIAPGYVAWGETFDVTVVVENRLPRFVFELSAELATVGRDWKVVESTPLATTLSAGQATRGRWKLVALRRGELLIPAIDVTSAFPLRIFRFAVEVSVDRTIVVFPRIDDSQSMVLDDLSDRYQNATSECLLNGIEGDYIGSREYSPGVPVRRWDHNNWARVGVPVVCEFGELARPRVKVVVDTSIALPVDSSVRLDDNGGDDPRLEACLSLAAGVVCELLRRDWIIDQMVVGDSSHDLGATTGEAQLPLALTVLAIAKTASTESTQAALVGDATAPVILVTASDGSNRTKLIDHLSRQSHSLTVMTTSLSTKWHRVDAGEPKFRQVHVANEVPRK